MSFILDALKKSETERQQQAGAEFSSVPSSPGNAQSFKWLWILALLLLVNVVVLIGVLMRPDKVAPEVAIVAPMPKSELPVSTDSFEEKIAAASQNQPAPLQDIETAAAPLQSTTRLAIARNRPRVLTIDEVRVNGSLQMKDLHLDIHVFSEDAAERFVFINMTKYREQSQLDEGPRVIEITPGGVVLEHEGVTFLLPRE
ncbi:MAG: general secretion pathway protein GspB [Gammaproteobacteria bacterium]|nr:general secretion pathway protein GspB [Gammaproteobacteria bacterium]